MKIVKTALAAVLLLLFAVQLNAQVIINTNKVAERGLTTSTVFSPYTAVNYPNASNPASIRNLLGYDTTIAPSDRQKNSSTRALATFDVTTSYSAINSAKLHIIVNASQVPQSTMVNFYVAVKNIINTNITGSDFNLTASSQLIDNFNLTNNLGVDVEKNVVGTPPDTGFDTEYVIDVTTWYQNALNAAQVNIGFLFYYAGGPLIATGFPEHVLKIYAGNGLGAYVPQQAPWLEISASSTGAVPEPISAMLLGIAVSVLGIIKKFSKN